MTQVSPKSSTPTTPVWGERTVSALLAIPCVVATWTFLLAVPVIGWFFAFFEMIVLRFWNWVHTLNMPGWLESILIFVDHVIEKFVVVISDIIRWIVGPRDRSSDTKSQVSKR